MLKRITAIATLIFITAPVQAHTVSDQRFVEQVVRNWRDIPADEQALVDKKTIEDRINKGHQVCLFLKLGATPWKLKSSYYTSATNRRDIVIADLNAMVVDSAIQNYPDCR